MHGPNRGTLARHNDIQTVFFSRNEKVWKDGNSALVQYMKDKSVPIPLKFTFIKMQQ